MKLVNRTSVIFGSVIITIILVLCWYFITPHYICTGDQCDFKFWGKYHNKNNCKDNCKKEEKKKDEEFEETDDFMIYNPPPSKAKYDHTKIYKKLHRIEFYTNLKKSKLNKIPKKQVEKQVEKKVEKKVDDGEWMPENNGEEWVVEVTNIIQEQEQMPLDPRLIRNYQQRDFEEYMNYPLGLVGKGIGNNTLRSI